LRGKFLYKREKKTQNKGPKRRGEKTEPVRVFGGIKQRNKPRKGRERSEGKTEEKTQKTEEKPVKNNPEHREEKKTGGETSNQKQKKSRGNRRKAGRRAEIKTQRAREKEGSTHTQ
jgi:hypothetical protein